MSNPVQNEISGFDTEDSVPKILVVDDEPMNLTAMEAALAGLSCEQVHVTSGAAALRELLSVDFSIILLDVQLPGMNGFETAELIRRRERSRDIPIIFVTAFNQRDTDMQLGYKLGAVDYLFKPIVPEVLRAKVTALVNLRERTQKVERQARQLQALLKAEAEHHLQEERRKWEAELLKIQNQQLAEADQRKDEFLAILAHELRTPLAPLTSGLNVLLEGGASKQETTTLHHIMARQIRHLTRLVDDLLDVGRISSGKLELHTELTSMDRLVEHALDACRSRIEELEQQVHLSGPEDSVLLHVDAVRLVQVLVNLLNNASRYSERRKNIYISWGRNEGKAFVTVRDEGCGIAPTAQRTIFDMFVQERKSGPGLGIGLTLVKQIVEMHGGTIAVFSDGRDKGSSFTIELPLQAVPLDSEDEVPRSVDHSVPSSHAQLRIALVEDDDDIRETMSLVLRNWGHSVEVAPNGAAGVELITRMRPDVALLDLSMPVLDGLQAAEEICRLMGTSRPALIALSGYGQDKDRARTQKAGFDMHLVKPADPAVLRRALLEVVERQTCLPPSNPKS